jgi:hypothetical protein
MFAEVSALVEDVNRKYGVAILQIVEHCGD